MTYTETVHCPTCDMTLSAFDTVRTVDSERDADLGTIRLVHGACPNCSTRLWTERFTMWGGEPDEEEEV